MIRKGLQVLVKNSKSPSPLLQKELKEIEVQMPRQGDSLQNSVDRDGIMNIVTTTRRDSINTVNIMIDQKQQKSNVSS